MCVCVRACVCVCMCVERVIGVVLEDYYFLSDYYYFVLITGVIQLHRLSHVSVCAESAQRFNKHHERCSQCCQQIQKSLQEHLCL